MSLEAESSSGILLQMQHYFVTAISGIASVIGAKIL